jgi:hypothetical protein
VVFLFILLLKAKIQEKAQMNNILKLTFLHLFCCLSLLPLQVRGEADKNIKQFIIDALNNPTPQELSPNIKETPLGEILQGAWDMTLSNNLEHQSEGDTFLFYLAAGDIENYDELLYPKNYEDEMISFFSKKYRESKTSTQGKKLAGLCLRLIKKSKAQRWANYLNIPSLKTYSEEYIRKGIIGDDFFFAMELIEKSKQTPEEVINVIWEMMESPSKEDQLAADKALIKIATGQELRPVVFSLDDDPYWDRLAEVLGEKYRSSNSEALKRASAIYLRQIRRGNSDAIGDKIGVPTLKELTGYEPKPGQL